MSDELIQKAIAEANEQEGLNQPGDDTQAISLLAKELAFLRDKCKVLEQAHLGDLVVIDEMKEEGVAARHDAAYATREFEKECAKNDALTVKLVSRNHEVLNAREQIAVLQEIATMGCAKEAISAFRSPKPVSKCSESKLTRQEWCASCRARNAIEESQ